MQKFTIIQYFYHNIIEYFDNSKEFDSLEEKLDNFVKEMSELKAENAKIVEMQVSSNKKILRLENENEDLKNENVKYKIKLENIQKGLNQTEVNKKKF